MTTKTRKFNAKLEQQIHDQRKWIKEHGDTLTAYILRYGSAKDAEHYGDGGEAIWAADNGTLTHLLEQR